MYVGVASLYVEMCGALIDYHQCIWHQELSMDQLRVWNMSFLRNQVVKTIRSHPQSFAINTCST